MRPYQPSMLYPGIVIAPSLSDLLSSYSCVRSMSFTAPRPSQRGHMPPRTLKLRFSLVVRPPRSNVTAPAPLIDATLKKNAWGDPMYGLPSRLKRMRSIALASVAVPTVERGSVPMRSWSTMIAVVSPSSTSTSGRPAVGMNPWTKALYVSLISRCDSAAIVLDTRELLPEPETPVKTVSRRLGISTLMSLRLFSRAPCTRMRSWVSAAGRAISRCVSVAVLIGSPSPGRGRLGCLPDRRVVGEGRSPADAHLHDTGGGAGVTAERRRRVPFRGVVAWKRSFHADPTSARRPVRGTDAVRWWRDAGRLRRSLVVRHGHPGGHRHEHHRRVQPLGRVAGQPARQQQPGADLQRHRQRRRQRLTAPQPARSVTHSRSSRPVERPSSASDGSRSALVGFSVSSVWTSSSAQRSW